MLALANGEKIVRTDKLICEVLNSAPAPVLPELLAARHQAGLAIFDATGRYRPSDEPYLNWHGKAQAWTQAISPTTARREENLAQDGDHLYLEGDNLSVLKLLLPQLQGKVQVVYADPPYNTGKNFVYADNFVLSPSAYERRYGTAERCYGVAEPCSGAVSEAGRWHAQWCSFIYPRLLLARELMAENAVIFLSIDDHECHNLKLILDEVFGDANFVTQLVWQRAYAAKNDAKTVPVSHDYVLMYAKNKICWEEATQPNLGRQLLRRTLVGDSQEGMPTNSNASCKRECSMGLSRYASSSTYWSWPVLLRTVSCSISLPVQRPPVKRCSSLTLPMVVAAALSWCKLPSPVLLNHRHVKPVLVISPRLDLSA